MKKIILILLMLLWGNLSFSQDGLSYQAGLLSGFILKGKLNKEKSILGGYIDINRKTTGKKYWQADHNYPQMGLNISVTELNNYDQLKFSYAAIPYLEFNLTDGPMGQLQVKHGTGLAIVTGKIDGSDDQLIGSRLNAASILDLGYNYTEGGNYAIKMGLRLSHVSNGNLVNPNSGINSLALYLQLNYFPGQMQQKLIPYEKNTSFKRWSREGRISTGLYNYKNEENTINVDYQILAMLTYQHNTRFRTGAGLEVIFPDNKSSTTAIFLEESVCIAHLVTRYGLGIYINEIQDVKSRIYEKVGIAYFPLRLKNEIARGLSIGADIKAHRFKAAHIDLTIGYLF